MVMISKITSHFIFQLRVQRKNVWKDSQQCISEIQAWMRINFLKLNDDKTQFLVTGTIQQLALADNLKVLVGSDPITNLYCVRNLGYYIDSKLKIGKPYQQGH